MRNCLSRQGQGGFNGRAQSTTLSELESRPTKLGNSFGTGGGQCQNMLYALKAHQDQEGSPVVTCTLRVFDLDVYALLDLGDTHSFVTAYIEVQFSVSAECLSEHSQSLLKSVTQLCLDGYT